MQIEVPVRKGWKLTESQKAEVYSRIKSGEGPTKLGREFGVAHGAIQSIVRNRDRGLTNFNWKPTLKLPDNPVDLAYIAGLVDGEGSFYQRSQDNNWYFKLGMTDKPIMEWLATFGGTFHVWNRPAHFKTAYHWCVSRRADLKILINTLLPYLRVKHDIAQVALNSIGGV